MDHERRFQLCLEMARTVFEKQGSHIAQLVSFSESEGAKMLVFPEMTDETKDVIEGVMIAEAKQGVDALCWTTEAWMLKGKKGDLEGKRPSESPDRIEILMVSYEAKDIWWEGIAEIHRHGSPIEDVSLGEWQINRDSVGGGRFVGTWRKAGL